ncbi:MAG: sulfotransferase [Planctomycetaceae bacterium]|nr:sulfotransferase [Planctomycetaceae bacterium]
MPYGNFHNPVGLVGRMLLSRKRAAYAALLRAGLEIALTPVDYVLSKVNGRSKGRDTESNQPLLFIVGPPRAGTTLIYQYVAASVDVSYATNLSSLFPKSLINGNCSPVVSGKHLRSYFGQTARLSDPNDAFHIWNRWFGDDRYRTKTELTDGEVDEMRMLFDSWTMREGKPFLNKNNRNCHCLAMLADTLPNAYFIVVSRDATSIARSLIRARKSVQGDKSVGWGLLSQEQHAHEPLGYVRDVCEQVQNVQRLITEQSASIAESRLIRVSYESFCENPNKFVDAITEKVDGVHRRELQMSELPDSLRPSPARPLSEAEEDAIVEFLAA